MSDTTTTDEFSGMLEQDPILKFFGYKHLRPQLMAYSKPWAELAAHVVKNTPRNAERSVALRKLLEGKDAAVRAVIDELL
jgi:hypothetical protein